MAADSAWYPNQLHYSSVEEEVVVGDFHFLGVVRRAVVRRAAVPWSQDQREYSRTESEYMK